MASSIILFDKWLSEVYIDEFWSEDIAQINHENEALITKNIHRIII